LPSRDHAPERRKIRNPGGGSLSNALNIDGADGECGSRSPGAREVCMRATRTRWATCALAISLCHPALADRQARSVASCTSFDQTERGEDLVEFTIRSACSMPIDCAVSWRVVCAPESKKRRASHAGAARFAISGGASQSAEASASVCGDDTWLIDSVRWSCWPNKD
jgi:hypothetical protein